MCFVLWNKVILKIGAIKSNNFIYLIPLITMASSTMMLDEPIKLIAVIRGVLIIFGVYISENKNKEEIIKNEVEIN
ncbi:DMT family transporter [uncultured Clostridium sp.]|uniref:DMT family transporter n=1 Tax=uncultured Clostridium sp. TaxID=59620 RepID=UPI00280B4FCF|nr:DMT family transporter [uncultured Clostridium sp.]